jgi:hypothetical protein
MDTVQSHSKAYRLGKDMGKGRAFVGVGAALLLGGALFGGCDEPGSPAGAVQRVAAALDRSDEAGLREGLSGAALRRFGNADGARALREAVAGRGLALGTPVLRYRDARPSGMEHYRIYSLPVFEKGHGTPALVATVTCSVHWVSRTGYVYRDPVPGSPRGAEGFTPVESCRVSNVEAPELPAAGSVLCERAARTPEPVSSGGSG